MNIRSTSMPAGILISELWRQVATGSLQDSMENVQGPTASGVNEACQMSGSVASLAIRTGRRGAPSGPTGTTSALSSSCPSLKIVALTANGSPTAAFAG